LNTRTGALRIWLIDFDRSQEGGAAALDLAAPPAWLPQDDQERLSRMLHPRRRSEFLLGRRLLRHALRETHGPRALEWRLSHADKGRPYLAGDLAVPSLSISHCARLVACALGPPSRMGLDVESSERRKTDFAKLAQAVFHPLEHEALARSGQTLECGFLERWTLKEALAKALGVGLTLPMRDFAFVNDRLAAAPPEFGDPSQWQFARPSYRSEVVIGVAWEGPVMPEIALQPVEIAVLFAD
jgi:4'-phosphopantetheinyl transferase